EACVSGAVSCAEDPLREPPLLDPHPRRSRKSVRDAVVRDECDDLRAGASHGKSLADLALSERSGARQRAVKAIAAGILGVSVQLPPSQNPIMDLDDEGTCVGVAEIVHIVLGLDVKIPGSRGGLGGRKGRA